MTLEFNKDLLQAGGGRGRRICPECGEAISWGNLSHHIRVKHNTTSCKCKNCYFPSKVNRPTDPQTPRPPDPQTDRRTF